MSFYEIAFTFNILIDGIILTATIVGLKIWKSEDYTFPNDVVFILLVHLVMYCLLVLVWKLMSLDRSTYYASYPMATSFLMYNGIMCIISAIYFGYSVTTLISNDISSMEYAAFICRVLSGPVTVFYSLKLFVVYKHFKETQRKEDTLTDIMSEQLIA